MKREKIEKLLNDCWNFIQPYNDSDDSIAGKLIDRLDKEIDSFSKPNEDGEKKLYFRIYLDRESIDDYYVGDFEEIKSVSENYLDYSEGELFPVFEPIYMTVTEFNNLPEFKGF